MRKMKREEDAYLKGRPDVYHLQLPVPIKVQQLYLKSQRFITGTLGTKDLNQASELRDEIVHKCRRLFKLILDANVEIEGARKLTIRDVLNGTTDIPQKLSEAIQNTPETSLFKAIAEEVTRQGTLASQELMAGNTGKAENHQNAVDAGYDRLVELLENNYAPTPDEDTAYSRALYTAGGIVTITTLTEKYLEANTQFPTKTVEKKQRHVARLIKFIGADIEASKVTLKVAAEYVHELNRSPKPGSQTKKDIISDFDTIWSFGTRHLLIKQNPWTGRRQDINSTTRGTEAPRYPWRNEHVVAICDALQDTTIKHAESLIPYTLIGIYSGIRISEIAYLKIKDILIEDVIRVNITAGKNQATVRVIAFHPALAPLLKKLIANSKDGFLIPDSDSVRGRGTRGSTLYSEFKRDLFGSDLTKYTYHSFRHRFKDVAAECEMPDVVSDKFIGHKNMYGQGVSLQKQLEWLLKMEQGADVEDAAERLMQHYLKHY